MRRLLGWMLGLGAGLFLGLAAGSAAERSLTLLPGTDLPGSDFATLKQVTEDACQAACVGDRACQAFTYNQKANWCFLKSAAGNQTPFDGALSGIIVTAPDADTIINARIDELPFEARNLIIASENLAQTLAESDPPPPATSYAELVAQGDDAMAAANPEVAIIDYRQALGIANGDPAVWTRLAKAALAVAATTSEQGERQRTYDLAALATSASLQAFLKMDGAGERAELLGLLADALSYREMWREAIKTYRTSIALVDDAVLQAKLDKAVAEHGFRITNEIVEAESESPRICADFSESLPGAETDLSAYVVVEDTPRAAVETSDSRICVSGLQHGTRYQLRFRAGLPSAEGEVLQSDVNLSLYVPDRTPFVGFANNAYVMPGGLSGGLPITSVNAETAEAVLYRIGDRSIATAVRNNTIGRTLDSYAAETIADQSGAEVWRGEIDLASGARNTLVTTNVLVDSILPPGQPGAYVITAKIKGADTEYWEELATQWFIVTDLGVSVLSGDDGVHAFIRSLTSAAPVEGATVRLVAINNEILGETTTDASGQAAFAPGLSRGTGGNAPQLITVETAEGDYAFLDIDRAAFDLSDRGVEGRPAPGPLDLYATTERGVYRPGESVFVTALLRDVQARAVTGLPLTLTLERPDGVINRQLVLSDQGAGAYFTELVLSSNAMRGAWHIRLNADPEGETLADLTVLVEDFEPERLAFDLMPDEAPLQLDEPTEVPVAAKYLYGTTAPDLAIEADTILRPVTGLSDFPGYTFGRHDDTARTNRLELGTVARTDASGDALVTIDLPSFEATTRPLTADIIMRLVDVNGRSVERSFSRPVKATDTRIGIREVENPGEGELAFEVITVSPDNAQIAAEDLDWRLVRVETCYQWYRDGSTWKFEPITTTHPVRDGTIDTSADAPAVISADVDWGRYRIEVDLGGARPTASSLEAYAGYYYAEAGSDSPDKLDVALDKDAYRSGDVAQLRLTPQFAGTALVMVLDNRIIDMQAVEVPEGGATVELPVTDDWGPGAYVTATLFRPADIDEKRMPSRALGLAYADVDPGDRKLDVTLDAAEVSAPRQPLPVSVSLGNAEAGETAYVAIAAVDLGILNLTSFPVPDPDGWYFGQRRLGMELRDLYGRLIDPNQGLPGAVRSGGDGEAARTGSLPATSVLVALHSGIVALDENGEATVDFDIPDFSGTVRLMAIAWTEDAVGHASYDAVVRDPVVVTLSPPRFLRTDDASRLLVEVNNVSGEPGTYRVDLDTGDGLTTSAAETEIDLPVGERTALDLDLVGAEIGTDKMRVTVIDPSGDALVKELPIGVRPTSPDVIESELIGLAPGESITLDAARFEGMIPNAGSLTLAAGPLARLNVPELLIKLDRYPYGCAEQITSRALPLLYLAEVASMLDMGSASDIDQRIEDAIEALLAKQTSTGGFGLWSANEYYTALWLDAYVTDFLIRAEAEGYDVPQLALERALDAIANQLSYASDFDAGGEDIAYALYVSARAGRAAIGDLRYYYEARLDNFGTPLAKAQIGAALALYGDKSRAASAFEAAVASLTEADDPRRWRTDYGSQLRDAAAVLALAAEFIPSGLDLPALTGWLGELRDAETYTSTQEDAWTLLAAAAAGRGQELQSITVDDQPHEESAYRRFTQSELTVAPVTIANNGNRPTELKISVTGVPRTPPAADANGFKLSRTFYRLDGTPFDPVTEPVQQNDRFVVLLQASAANLGSGQYMLADWLPAGFEIENPDLSAGAGVGDLKWLSVSTPEHSEARTDSYLAAFRYTTPVERFSSAYMVRAVSPGTFTLPGATVEDMYRPEQRANTGGGTVVIAPAD